MALNTRDNTSTGVSPFFLDHGFHMESLDIDLPDMTQASDACTPADRANAIISKLRDALDFASTSMAAAQNAYEDSANRHRDPAPAYDVGDKVWLDLRNIRTDRPSKKLDIRSAKYTILEKIGSHAYRLDTPPGIHPVFHVSLLRPAASDPFPSQEQTDWQPPAMLVDGNEEFRVEEILDERFRRWGRGHRHEYLVKWSGYQTPTWEPARNFEGTVALDAWLAHRPTSSEGGIVDEGCARVS